MVEYRQYSPVLRKERKNDKAGIGSKIPAFSFICCYGAKIKKPPRPFNACTREDPRRTSGTERRIFQNIKNLYYNSKYFRKAVEIVIRCILAFLTVFSAFTVAYLVDSLIPPIGTITGITLLFLAGRKIDSNT